MAVVVRRYIDFLILLIHTPLVYTEGVKKKFTSTVRTTGRVIPFRSRFVFRAIAVLKPFPFCPTGSPSVLVNGPYGVIKHAQSLIAVISAGRLATVQ